MKYIIRRYSDEDTLEYHAKHLFRAIRIKKKLKKELPDSYCCIVKVPFRKRHPDFPIWFSIASLLLVGIAPELDSCIRHILQTVQIWK